MKRILVTGGSGLLGNALKTLSWSADVRFPTRQEMNIEDFKSVSEAVNNAEIDTVLHAAAFTSPPLVEKDPAKALESNIVGTCNVVRACMAGRIRLVYVSTDYVFRGDRGGYKEDDEVHPVNKYAWSKLGGECAVRLYDNSLIVRTSFGPDAFPFPKAFSDQWTSRESVSAIARKIKELTEGGLMGVVHVGAGRRTVYEYAVSLGASVEKLSVNDVNFRVPRDTSLDTSRYAEWKKALS
jgi:dTDP-4-dehydrorhamnose reductase